MCIDFKMLNKQIVINAYPIPQIDKILDHLLLGSTLNHFRDVTIISIGYFVIFYNII